MAKPQSSPSQSSLPHRRAPNSILIIGAGVFGLSTALSLLSSPHYARTRITLLDPYLPSLESPFPSTSPTTPSPITPSLPSQNPHAASIDSSRIIRPDYAEPAYAKLASAAQLQWRKGFGGQGVYRECGFILSADESGSAYVDKASENARALGCRVEALRSREEVARLLGSGGSGGERGYVNWGSGWADAEGALWWLLGEMVGKARERGMVDFIRERARRLVYRDCAGGKRRRVVGVETVDGSEVFADLTVVAAGAWSGALVDLRGRAEARGQVLAYVSISEEEREILKDMPVILNLSTGMFAIPPTADTAKHSGTGGWAVKVARHAYGYANPTRVAPESEEIVTSLPAERFEPIPEEGKLACREFLREVIPWLGEREWSSTRICWYTDTPTGNFLIDYHLEREGLFLATGGSGHGFKFLPVLGDKVVAAIDGSLEDELSVLWRWPEEKLVPFMGTEDGSRTGRRDMVLDQS